MNLIDLLSQAGSAGVSATDPIPSQSYKGAFYDNEISANVIRFIRRNQVLSCGYIRSGSAPIFDAKGHNLTITRILAIASIG